MKVNLFLIVLTLASFAHADGTRIFKLQTHKLSKEHGNHQYCPEALKITFERKQTKQEVIIKDVSSGKILVRGMVSSSEMKPINSQDYQNVSIIHDTSGFYVDQLFSINSRTSFHTYRLLYNTSEQLLTYSTFGDRDLTKPMVCPYLASHSI